jgi:predicted RNase H-like HicB family nuclease
MSEKSYPIAIVKLSDEDGGGYAAYVPDLYGCMSDGDTEEEALHNVKDAILEWCDEAVRLGREIPEPFSLAKAKKQEREALVALIRKQDEVLKEHGQTLELLKEEVAQITSRLEALCSLEQNKSSGFDFWAFPSLNFAGTSRRQVPH